jgi:hypothetical protein
MDEGTESLLESPHGTARDRDGRQGDGAGRETFQPCAALETSLHVSAEKLLGPAAQRQDRQQ